MPLVRRVFLALALVAFASAVVPLVADSPAVGDQTVYVTKTGAKYHSAGCSSLRLSSRPIKLKDAVTSYGACGRCRPPVLAATSAPVTAPPTVSEAGAKARASSVETGRCQATTKKGTQCSRRARSGGFCWQHGG